MIALDNGFDEATAIVLEVDASIARLNAIFGYRTIWRGQAAPATLELMGIDPSWTADEALIGDPAQGRGNIRLFAFPGRDTGVMRDGAQAWDSGGLFDINIRALSAIEPIHAAMTRHGFCAFGPLTAWDFGALSVKEVVSRDADGLAIAVMQRMAPPLTGYDDAIGDTSYVFNSTQVVPDFDAARAFYVDALGWSVVQESTWAHASGDNCLGLPLDVARVRDLKVGIYQANGRNEGSVEVLEYTAESLHFAEAGPPARGWATLRFPMSDIEGFLVSAARGGCTILPPRVIRMEPWGDVTAAAAVTPWGVRLEAFRR
ncbi:hypothetical protein [Sphingomonas sp. OK281]|uniref:hypothetical protein n=1 Tax=Sphingomonas sp. OK281 TaxID=1881067 RepID=UPI0008E0F8D1|nr:hypothetical protein [Sphingomonas sp. OK281]SFO02931.1 hypothetical protein SAMN05428984_1720 [Sphingomonas sp. OK281]